MTINQLKALSLRLLFPMFPGARCLLLLAVFAVVSCAHVRRVAYPDAGYGVASWYGPDFHGKPTASGERYDMYKMTCAHKEYPFGTRLEVTNVSNGKSVGCVVNDRGPFVAGRDIDLSYAAAKEIDLVRYGTGRVRLTVMGRDMEYVKTVRYVSVSGPYTIQAGSFNEIDNARRLKSGLELKYKEVHLTEARIKNATYYRVRVGKFHSIEKAYSLAKSMAEEGYSPLIMHYDESL